MKCFNLRRFGLVVRLDLLSGWKRYVRYLASLYAGCMAIEFVNFYDASTYGLSEGYLRPAAHAFPNQPAEILAAAEAALLRDSATPFLAFLGFALALAASAIFENLRTKGGRTAFLTLPATNTEKYLARLLWATVGATAGFWVAYAAADVTRMALFPVFGHSFGSTVPYALHELMRLFSSESYFHIYGLNSTEYALACALYVELFLTFHAVYLLCGTLLRRHPYLLTTLGLMALGALSIVLVDQCARGNESVSHMSDTAILTLIDSVLLVCFVTCYTLSYRCFCRIQVVGHKWWGR